VLAVHGLVGAAAGAVGGPLLGWACDAVGPRPALTVSGAVAATSCLVAVAVFARLRGIPVPALVRRPSPAAAATA